MQIIHDFGNSTVKKESQEDSAFLLTNKKTSFFSLSNTCPLSRYNGFYFFDNGLHKSINNLSVNKEIKKIINRGAIIERYYDSGFEQFIMSEGKDVLFYLTKGLKELNISLDMRPISDFDDKDRYYEITTESGCLLIYYRNKNYNSYLAIATNGLKFEKITQWRKETYSFDKKRDSQPDSMFVFDAIKIFLKPNSFISFSASLDKDMAITNATFGLNNFFNLKQRNTNPRLKVKKTELNCAYQSCINSLHSLSNHKNGKYGLFAGIPWFYSLWTRDALISCGGLIKEKHYPIKYILLNILKNIKEDGHLPNMLPNYGSNADSIGWLVKRLSEIKLSSQELKEIIPKLTKSVDDMIKFSTKNDLAFNYDKETWMDSISRPGARIEIQALRLFIYHYLYDMTSDVKYFELEQLLKKEVIDKFWADPILADGYHDFKKDLTVRPNIFIAYYLYPTLLTKKEWVKCFDYALEKLWLDWGALSTIAKDNMFFKPKHTGENSKSYHSGDSWYWINNLVAICLSRLDKKKYKQYIDKILEASTNDILYKGFIGHHSEISSAYQQEAFGCWAQAWSASTYIELIHELYSGLDEKAKFFIKKARMKVKDVHKKLLLSH